MSLVIFNIRLLSGRRYMGDVIGIFYVSEYSEPKHHKSSQYQDTHKTLKSTTKPV